MFTRDGRMVEVVSGRYRAGMGEAPVTAPVPTQEYQEPGSLIFQRTLTASQALLDLAILNDGDSDILVTSAYGTQTGTYTIRIKLPSGRYLTSTQVRNANQIGTAQFPVAIGQILVPRNGQLKIDITDTSVANNAVEILFGGIRLYATRP